MSARAQALFRIPCIAALAAILLGCAVGAADPAGAAPDSEASQVSRWQEVDRLVEDQLYERAASLVAELRSDARAAGDVEGWTRGLIQEVQLRTALHGYEKAVTLLREEPWPESPRHRAILDLFYAHGLVEYAGAYSWEIRQRERIDSGVELELSGWTLDQIASAATESYARVWAGREIWGGEPLGWFARYVKKNDYPERIRGTLRDTVTYLWAELLADSSLWRPEQSNELYRLDVDALISPLSSSAGAGSADVHPLSRRSAILGDLEAWHLDTGRHEAALEARLERLRGLRGALSAEADLLRIRAALESHLEAFDRALPWWAVGQALLAELVRAEDQPDSEIRARRIAVAGLMAHRASIGGRRCAHLVASIDAPSMWIEAMATDGTGRRSIRILHKNVPELHFRAYRVDMRARLQRTRDNNLLPGRQDVEGLIATREPDYSWSRTLPETPDFRAHATFETPPIEAVGTYVIVATTNPREPTKHGLFSAVPLVISDLVIVRREAAASVEVTVRSGGTGKPLHNVALSLWLRDYRRGHHSTVGHNTDAFGQVRIRFPGERGAYFLVAETDDEFVVDDSYLSKRRLPESSRRQAGLIYTDRSVYRPGQEVHWKLVAYQGDAEEGSYETLAGGAFEVELVDGGGEVVEMLSVETNEFGSASGSFTIPAGRRLGGWNLRSSVGASQWIRVEEYKRPTFEVTILDPGERLRLNRPARLTGEARYYFGLPVTGGSVAWRVEREPVYPYWWHWRSRPVDSRQTIAAGIAELDSEGRFAIEFLPEADEREGADRAISYRYSLAADVTDEGGETRSGSSLFRLGFVAVEATIRSERGFFRPGDPAVVEVARTDLDGRSAPGEARWRLLEIDQPDATALPADQPVLELESVAGTFATPGDALRGRWEPALSFEQLLRTWPDGRELDAGSVTHGADGVAALDLGALEAGLYRLRYETTDEFGAVAEAQTELLVAGGEGTRLASPAVLLSERSSVPVGGTARLFVHSGLEDQELVLEAHRNGRRTLLRRFNSSDGAQLVEIPIDEELRGGFGVRLTALRDYQLMMLSESVFVPWDDRKLAVEFESFRDRLTPGARERWTVRLRGAEGESLAAGSAELLAYMYDRSLDLFAPHEPFNPLYLYPEKIGGWSIAANLGARHPVWAQQNDLRGVPGYPDLRADRLIFFDGYPIGGPGRRDHLVRQMPMAAMKSAAEPESSEGEAIAYSMDASEQGMGGDADGLAPVPPALREDFSETAFWEPHLRLDADGSVAFEFTVPDSLTEWSVWVHALTTDLRSGTIQRSARTAKELMVRPYLPRFLREGDAAELRVRVDNAGESRLSGAVDLDIVDTATGESVRAEFGLAPGDAEGRPFTVEAGEGATLTFALATPPRVGEVAFRVMARAGDLSDGELRPLPILPGRMHLMQSRFVTLRDKDRRELTFDELARDDDPTRIDEQLVVTLDAQLFYSVLRAMPYLIDFPYECTEQTLNRFLSTGIVSSLFERYPAVARMAADFSERDTRLERWDEPDANRRMALEETPWLALSRGGRGSDLVPGNDLVKVLDPKIARAERDVALGKLEQAQLPSGAFPWWPGGPPSPYMTLYLTYGFAKALEFDVELPKEMVVRAWSYLHSHWRSELSDLAEGDGPYELVTFLNYVLSSYPDASWTGDVFSAGDRRRMLDTSFREWRRLSPMVKGYLALTLARAGRDADAEKVWESVMDSAKTTRDEGTFWAPEDRAWLWYNDTIESHAFALRVLGELDSDDERRHGLVQWLLLNKKLNHWKSTRATAEVVYSLVHYLDQEGQLGAREAATVEIGPRRTELVFEPDEYTGRKNQIVIRGDEISPAMATTVVEKETPGFMFASATWHFSTERLPEEGSGDLFAVTRTLYRRAEENGERVLRPLAEGERLEVGDQVEVHLVIRARHAAEYVHLRDPRAAGFEPESLTSGYRWNLGIGWFEEIRDSGANFFFDRLPAGELTLKYRLRAATSGAFKLAPATLQSMYAPEFAGYSAGATVAIER